MLLLDASLFNLFIEKRGVASSSPLTKQYQTTDLGVSLPLSSLTEASPSWFMLIRLAE